MKYILTTYHLWLNSIYRKRTTEVNHCHTATPVLAGITGRREPHTASHTASDIWQSVLRHQLASNDNPDVKLCLCLLVRTDYAASRTHTDNSVLQHKLINTNFRTMA